VLACGNPGAEEGGGSTSIESETLSTESASEGGTEVGGVCGDGQVDAGEACDDGNAIRGDGCSPACLLSGTHLDCVTLLEGSLDNSVAGLVASVEGTFIAGGAVETDASTQAWIGRFTPDGTRLWFHELEGGEFGGEIVDLTTDGEGGAWLLHYVPFQTFVQRVDVDGQLGPPVDVGSVEGVKIAASVIDWGPAGLWLGGSAGGNSWVGRLDTTALSIATVLYEDYLGYFDRVGAISHTTSETVVAATVSTTPNYQEDVAVVADTDIMIVHFDSDSNETGRTTLGASGVAGYARRALGLAFNDDAWFVAGLQEPINILKFNGAWLAKTTPDIVEWSSLMGDGRFSYDDILAIDGNVVLVGNVNRDAEGFNWFAGFDSDGALSWSHDHETPVPYGKLEIMLHPDGAVWAAEEIAGESTSEIRACAISL
jgi:cysteine-rich repeat protein